MGNLQPDNMQEKKTQQMRKNAAAAVEPLLRAQEMAPWFMLTPGSVKSGNVRSRAYGVRLVLSYPAWGIVWP